MSSESAKDICISSEVADQNGAEFILFVLS